MTGTLIGGKKAAQKNLARDSNFYGRIGAIGGRNGHTGGFAAELRCDGSCDMDREFGLDHTVAQCAGAKGGRVSKRRKHV